MHDHARRDVHALTPTAWCSFGPNNVRLYHDPTSGKFWFLPWGMDLSDPMREHDLDDFDAAFADFRTRPDELRVARP